MLRGEPTSLHSVQRSAGRPSGVLCLHLPLPLLCNNASNGLHDIFSFSFVVYFEPELLPHSTSDVFFIHKLRRLCRLRSEWEDLLTRQVGEGRACMCVSTTCCRRDDRARKPAGIDSEESIDIAGNEYRHRFKYSESICIYLFFVVDNTTTQCD